MPRLKGIDSHRKSGTGKNQVRQQTASRDKRCFNCKCSHSKKNELLSTVTPVPPTLNNSVINPPQLSSVSQQSSISSQNTTHESQASSILRWTSPDPTSTMPPPSTKNISRNIYICMVDVYKLKPAQRQKHAVVLLQYYFELCNTNEP